MRVCEHCNRILPPDGFREIGGRVALRWHSWCTECQEEFIQARKERERARKREYDSRYARLNRARKNEIENRRRARKVNAPGGHTAEEFQKLCESYGWVCLGCGDSESKLTADHVIPISKGGSDDITNIQPLCAPCNSAKYTHTWDFRTLQ